MKKRNTTLLAQVRPVAGGFSLIELLTVLAMTAMILAAALMIYGRVRTSAAAINARLDSHNIGDEVLQKIAEDIDRLAAPGFDTTITLRNKNENGYNSAQLVIENAFYGNGNPPKRNIYERVVWQSMYVSEEDRLILYRLHDGINLEDKIVVQAPPPDDKPQPEMFVPVCDGLTHFGAYALTGTGDPQPMWAGSGMPKGILLSVSTAPMIQLEDGTYYLPEESIIYRPVAVDRTRQIAYKFVPKKFDTEPNELDMKDPNEIDAGAASSESAANTSPDSQMPERNSR